MTAVVVWYFLALNRGYASWTQIGPFLSLAQCEVARHSVQQMPEDNSDFKYKGVSYTTVCFEGTR